MSRNAFYKIASGFLLLTLTACMVAESPRDRMRYQNGAKVLADCVATQCTRLNLDRANLRDFSVLNDLPHVTALMVSYTDFSDLNDIADMTQLDELHIRNAKVEDHTALANFPNLRVLHVSELDTAAEQQAVATLGQLEDLAVSLFINRDTAFLGELGNLKKLMLNAGEALDFTPLAKLTKLQDLGLGFQTVDDITPLLKIRSLEFVEGNNLTADQTKALEANGVKIVIIPVVVC